MLSGLAQPSAMADFLTSGLDCFTHETHRGSCSTQVSIRSSSALSSRVFRSLESGDRALCAKLHERVESVYIPR